MKIKTQLIITIVTFLLILSVIGLSIFNTNTQATILVNDHEISSTIEDRIASLNHIVDNFLLYQQNTQLSNWQSDITDLYSLISKLNSTDSNQIQFSNKLAFDVQEVDNAFNNTIGYLEKTPSNVTVRNDPEFQAVWSDLSEKF